MGTPSANSSVTGGQWAQKGCKDAQSGNVCSVWGPLSLALQWAEAGWQLTWLLCASGRAGEQLPRGSGQGECQLVSASVSSSCVPLPAGPVVSQCFIQTPSCTDLAPPALLPAWGAGPEHGNLLLGWMGVLADRPQQPGLPLQGPGCVSPGAVAGSGSWTTAQGGATLACLGPGAACCAVLAEVTVEGPGVRRGFWGAPVRAAGQGMTQSRRLALAAWHRAGDAFGLSGDSRGVLPGGLAALSRAARGTRLGS